MKKSKLRQIIRETINQTLNEQSSGFSYFQADLMVYGGNNFFQCIERSGPTEDSYCCNGSANNNPDPANYADKPLGWFNLSITFSSPAMISLSNWRSTECHPCPGGNNLSNFRNWMAGIGTTYSSNINNTNFINDWGTGDPYGVGAGWDPTLPINLGQCQSYNSSNPCNMAMSSANCDNCWFGYFTTKQACENAGMNGDWSGFGGMPYTPGANSSNPLYGCLDPLATNFAAGTTAFGTVTNQAGIVSDPSLCEYELYRCGHCNTPCTTFMVQNNPGLCVYDNPTDCTQGCDTQTADIERWTCMGPDKFGNQQGCRQCTQYEIDNAAPNTSFQGVQGTPYGCDVTNGHATQQDCENHPTTTNNSVLFGCAGPKKIEPTKTPQEPNINPVSPVKSDSQSKMIDPEIDRMQDLANIKREK